jgi:hypothetical protein
MSRQSGGDDSDTPIKSTNSTTKRETVEIDPLALLASGNNSGLLSNNGNLGQEDQSAISSPPLKPPPVVDVVEVMTALFISICR